MIYLISDTHGEYTDAIAEYLDMDGEDDILIILGDVGICFGEDEANREFDRLFFSSDKKIAFLDGNHENFKYIYSFPEEIWCGGRVHRLSESTVHLERGNIYEIDGKSFFVFGGCKSSEKWKTLGLWQSEETPSEEELRRAYSNLEKHGRRVDYILTHKYETQGNAGDEELFELCDFIDKNVTFKHWYAGHWHLSEKIDEKHTVVYSELLALE